MATATLKAVDSMIDGFVLNPFPFKYSLDRSTDPLQDVLTLTLRVLVPYPNAEPKAFAASVTTDGLIFQGMGADRLHGYLVRTLQDLVRKVMLKIGSDALYVVGINIGLPEVKAEEERTGVSPNEVTADDRSFSSRVQPPIGPILDTVEDPPLTHEEFKDLRSDMAETDKLLSEFDDDS